MARRHRIIFLAAPRRSRRVRQQERSRVCEALGLRHRLRRSSTARRSRRRASSTRSSTTTRARARSRPRGTRSATRTTRTICRTSARSRSQQGVAIGQGSDSPATGMAGVPTRLAYKRYFIRFDVTRARRSAVAREGRRSRRPSGSPARRCRREMRGAQRPPGSTAAPRRCRSRSTSASSSSRCR